MKKYFYFAALAVIGSTLTLVMLKLLGVLSFSWRWALSPLWVTSTLCTHAAVAFTLLLRHYLRKK